MARKKSLKVQNIIINWKTINADDYISLTDMVRGRRSKPGQIINNWLRSRNNLELIALVEEMINPDFKSTQFEHFYLDQVGKNDFAPTVNQFIEDTNSLSLLSKRGRGGGTWAYRDLAFSFGAFISPAFQLLLIREFQRLKSEESSRENLEWNANRFLTKRNYALQTDAIKNILLPLSLNPPEKDWLTYAGEADILNVALFGTTAKSWREKHPEEAKKGGNIRDHASNIQLLVLSNLEAINSELIKEGLPKEERFLRLAQSARDQLKIFLRDGKELK